MTDDDVPAANGGVESDGAESEGVESDDVDGVTGSDADVVARTEAVRNEASPGGLDVRGWVTTGQFGLSTPAWQALVAIVAVGLVARLVALGYRTMHFDEARVAYWTLRYAETGVFEYRYIIHGPFVQHVGAWLYPLVGANDVTARLPVAIVGGLMPLVGLLYRDYLRDEEIVGFALLLASNPVLLYYSRFLRSDLLVAAFVLVALGGVLRLLATHRVRYLYLATAAFAFAFASKENALVYLLAWAGAGLLVLDTELYRPRSAERGVGRVVDRVRSVRERDTRALVTFAATHGLLAILLFAGLTLFFFAPRAGVTDGIGIWRSVTNPATIPAVVEATVTDIGNGLGYWFGGAAEEKCFEDTLVAGYVCYQERFLTAMAKFAWPLTALAAAGFVVERYATADSRNLVMFASYWGVASVVGYPLGMDIWAVWPLTHALVALAIPAAVAFGLIVRKGAGSLADGDRTGVALSGVLVFALVASTAAAAYGPVYADPMTRDSETAMVQYAQPSQDMRPGIAAMDAAIAGSDGLDVLYLGDRYYLDNESAVAFPPPVDPDPNHSTGGWFNRLPLPWYNALAGADEIDSVEGDRDAVIDALDRDATVVVAELTWADEVDRRVDGYERFRYDIRAHIGGPGDGTTVVIFVKESAVKESAAADGTDP